MNLSLVVVVVLLAVTRCRGGQSVTPTAPSAAALVFTAAARVVLGAGLVGRSSSATRPRLPSKRRTEKGGGKAPPKSGASKRGRKNTSLEDNTRAQNEEQRGRGYPNSGATHREGAKTRAPRRKRALKNKDRGGKAPPHSGATHRETAKNELRGENESSKTNEDQGRGEAPSTAARLTERAPKHELQRRKRYA